MDIQIDAALKRARGYWFIDGFTEMAAGGLFVILAGILLFSGTMPRRRHSPAGSYRSPVKLSSQS